MLIRNFNRWAIVDYLRSYGRLKEDELFVKIADAIDTDVRPQVPEEDEEVISHLIKNCDEYKLHQRLCLQVVEILRKNYYDDARIVNFVAALMIDSTQRDLAWEKQHREFENRSNRGFRVDYMSLNPKEDAYLKPHRVI